MYIKRERERKENERKKGQSSFNVTQFRPILQQNLQKNTTLRLQLRKVRFISYVETMKRNKKK